MTSREDRLASQLVIYFPNPQEKKKFERDAERYGLSMNQLAMLIIKTGGPAVLRTLREAKKKQNQLAEQIVKSL